ncbi:MAG TPA: aminotransferase class IV [Puia sp.]|nr:aminotransferase class IV [Puia sp.]
MFLNFNGEVREEGAALITAGNRGFRYGDGLFETMLVREGRLRLGKYHLERLATGMRLLRLDFPSPWSLAVLEECIRELCLQNELGDAPVRARLTVFRGGSGPYNTPDREAWYCLQTVAAGETGWRKDGLTIDVFPRGRKACDDYSGIKSNNYLLSTQAGLYARELGLDDAVLLNTQGRVAETTIANIWWVRDSQLYTTPLSEGCVAGVMRRWLLEKLPQAGYPVREEPIGPAAMAGADEIFVSNAIQGIRWVRGFRGHSFDCRLSAELYKKMIDINQGLS